MVVMGGGEGKGDIFIIIRLKFLDIQTWARIHAYNINDLHIYKFFNLLA